MKQLVLLRHGQSAWNEENRFTGWVDVPLSPLVAHGNSLRALIKHLDEVGDADIVELSIPTGVPLVYELDDALEPIRHGYLD